ncbi:MAG: hypothetical protein BZY87_03615 [SAR202 cluster bacterium Io17-Chloro-G6]|nr:MAG: hypothetical protein BZY87_03615 [SAR202 cluster bacterium Io17-Chloro-G6]
MCLSMHHTPPTEFIVHNGKSYSENVLTWSIPGDRIRRSWNNIDDATRDGAYGISLAAIESSLGFYAISRAETGSGADYYVGPEYGLDKLEASYRLEIAGSNRGNAATIRRRLLGKVKQLRDGNLKLPGLASVVGFLQRQVEIELVGT